MCRSPLAERLTVSWVRQTSGGTAERITVSSAGLQAPAGRGMDPLSEAELVRLGGDTTGFAARRFTPVMAEDADLVLTMTRRQRRAVLEAAPRGLRRTFTLLEAADLLGRADLEGLQRLAPAARAQELARRLDAERAFRASSQADDIADPIGQPARVHHDVAERIAAALGPLASALFQPGGSGGESITWGGFAAAS